jgi:hypothetical protein
MVFSDIMMMMVMLDNPDMMMIMISYLFTFSAAYYRVTESTKDQQNNR